MSYFNGRKYIFIGLFMFRKEALEYRKWNDKAVLFSLTYLVLRLITYFVYHQVMEKLHY